MIFDLFFNIELYYIIFTQILKNNYLIIYLYFYLFINLWKKGEAEYNYINLFNNKFILYKRNYLFKIWKIILNSFEFILFCIMAYFPFLGLLRWNYYYSNKLNDKFRYSLRINHIIYKYDFILNDEKKDLQLKNIFNYLFKKWLMHFSYIITIYAIYLKIIFRLFFFYCLFSIYIFINLIKSLIYSNFWLLYIYDILRYIQYQLQILIIKKITKEFIKKFRIILDYLTMEFIYITYNVPYFFFISMIMTGINHLYSKIFSFYNRYKFENKSDNNTIPYKSSLGLFSFFWDYIFINNIKKPINNIYIQFQLIIKIILINNQIKIINNLKTFYNLINFRLYNNKSDKIYYLLYKIYLVIIQYQIIFLFIGFLNLLIINFIYKFILLIINFIYKIFINSIYILYLIILLIILLYLFDLYNLIINFKIFTILIKPIISFFKFIHYNLYYNELWEWFYNPLNSDNYFFNNKIILLSFKKFIFSLEFQKSNYFLLFLENIKNLQLIFSSIFEVNFTYFLELLYYWYYEFNFNIFTYIKILIYYFFYYIYIYVYIYITPFIFLNCSKYFYYYYFWHIYAYMLLFYKSILYYFIQLYLYTMPYYFFPKLLEIIFFLMGFYFKYKIIINYLNINNLLLEFFNIFVFIYVYLKKIILINIIFFIDIYFNIYVFYNIYFNFFIIFFNFLIKSINFCYYTFIFYLNYIHINLLFEIQNIIDLFYSNNRLSKFNYNKFTVSLEDYLYLDKTRILGLKIISPIGGDIIDYYKTFRPIFFFRNDSLSFINNNYFLKSIIYLKKNIYNIFSFIIINEFFPTLLRYLKYYFLLFYFIIYFIFRYIIINSNNYEYNLPYIWNKIIENDWIKLIDNKKFSKINKLKIKYQTLNSNLINIINNKYNKYIINQINSNIKPIYIKNFLGPNIRFRNYLNYNNLNNFMHKYKNYIYILNNDFNKILKELQKNYKSNAFIYSFCNLQNNIFEEEYYYKSKALNKIYLKKLEYEHQNITNKVIYYFNFLDNLFFSKLGPNWLLNKSYSTLFFNKSLGTEVILMPYYTAATEGFFWCLFVPLLFYYFIFYVSCNFYNMLDIQEHFFYIYFYIFLENIDIIYNFYITFISANEFVDYEFNFYSLSKKSMDEEFMFYFSEKTKLYNFLRKYHNLNFLYNKQNCINNSNYIIYSFKITKLYLSRFIILLFIIILYLYKYKIIINNKIIKKKYYNKFVISIFYHYRFIINKKFKLL